MVKNLPASAGEIGSIPGTHTEEQLSAVTTEPMSQNY